MAGLLDSLFSGSGILPFADRWSPVAGSDGPLYGPGLEKLRAALMGGGGGWGPVGMPPTALGYADAGSPSPSIGAIPVKTESYFPPAASSPPMPPAPAAAPPPAPSAGAPIPGPATAGPPSALDRLSAGLGGFANSSALLPGLFNLFSGLSTGKRSDPAGQFEQSQIATLQALLGAGVPQGVAQAAALNPEVLKTIAPQLYTKPELVETGTDPLTGRKSFAWKIPNQMSLQPAQPVAGGIAGGQAADFGARVAVLRDAGATQARLIREVPADYRSYVEALLQGKAIPANLGRPGPARAAVIAYAHDIDPNFDETQIPMRVQFAKSMGSTTPTSYGGQVTSAGTIIQHSEGAADALKTITQKGGLLAPSDTLNWFNGIKSAIRGQSGEKSFLDAKARWDADVKVIASELERLLSGSHGAEASKQYWLDKFNLNNGPTAAAATLDEAQRLMMGRLKEIAAAKERAYGGSVDPTSLLAPETKSIMERIGTGSRGATEPAATPASTPEGATATNPKTGEKIIFKGGKWVPLNEPPGRFST